MLNSSLLLAHLCKIKTVEMSLTAKVNRRFNNANLIKHFSEICLREEFNGL